MNTALIVALMCMWYAVPAAAKETLLAMPRNSTEHCYAEINVHGPYGVYFRVVPHPPGERAGSNVTVTTITLINHREYRYSEPVQGVGYTESAGPPRHCMWLEEGLCVLKIYAVHVG